MLWKTNIFKKCWTSFTAEQKYEKGFCYSFELKMQTISLKEFKQKILFNLVWLQYLPTKRRYSHKAEKLVKWFFNYCLTIKPNGMFYFLLSISSIFFILKVKPRKTFGRSRVNYRKLFFAFQPIYMPSAFTLKAIFGIRVQDSSLQL